MILKKELGSLKYPHDFTDELIKKYSNKRWKSEALSEIILDNHNISLDFIINGIIKDGGNGSQKEILAIVKIWNWARPPSEVDCRSANKRFVEILDLISLEFIEKYKLLEEAKIIFDNLDNMLIHLKSVWEDPETWWFAKKTQDNIKKFNYQFNNKGNIFSSLKVLLTAIIFIS